MSQIWVIHSCFHDKYGILGVDSILSYHCNTKRWESYYIRKALETIFTYNLVHFLASFHFVRNSNYLSLEAGQTDEQESWIKLQLWKGIDNSCYLADSFWMLLSCSIFIGRYSLWANFWTSRRANSVCFPVMAF